MAIKIAVANQKGGVGKTTTTLCLAQELQNKGYKVLTIDTDPQCNTTSLFGAKTEGMGTMMDILCGDEPAKECIQHTEYGDILPSDPALVDAETTVKVDERRFSHLKRSLKAIEGDYDYIVIDTPPTIGVALKNVLATIEWIIIPVEESGWSLSGLMDFAHAIELARDNNEKLKIMGILLIKSKENTKKSARIKELAESLSKNLDTKIFQTRIRESVKCVEALTEYAVPLHIYAPYCTTRLDYVKFAEEVIEEVGK